MERIEATHFWQLMSMMMTSGRRPRAKSIPVSAVGAVSRVDIIETHKILREGHIRGVVLHVQNQPSPFPHQTF